MSVRTSWATKSHAVCVFFHQQKVTTTGTEAHFNDITWYDSYYITRFEKIADMAGNIPPPNLLAQTCNFDSFLLNQFDVSYDIRHITKSKTLREIQVKSLDKVPLYNDILKETQTSFAEFLCVENEISKCLLIRNRQRALIYKKTLSINQDLRRKYKSIKIFTKPSRPFIMVKRDARTRHVCI